MSAEGTVSDAAVRGATDASGSRDAELLDAARAWLADDPDPDTRAELEALIAGAAAGDDAARAGIADRFGSRLAFGTAGLRGRLGAGVFQGGERLGGEEVHEKAHHMRDHVLPAMQEVRSAADRLVEPGRRRG